MKKFLLILSVFFLVSCADTTVEKVQQLKVGMTEEEAIKLLGEPYTKEYSSMYNTLKYTYNSGDGFYSYRHSLYVNIKNGKVYSWY